MKEQDKIIEKRRSLSVIPRKNNNNKIIQCPLCDKASTRFIKAHIPTGQPKGSRRYLVCINCENLINFIISPQKQLTLTLKKARNIIKKNMDLKLN